MAVIRIGRIDNFKGADTVLIEADAEGVKVLAALFRTLSTGVQSRAEVHNWPSARSYGAITLLAERFPDDAGLIERRRGEVVFGVVPRRRGHKSPNRFSHWKARRRGTNISRVLPTTSR